MDSNSMQVALNTLIRVKENLMQTMVEELLKHQEDDANSFSFQEIEDKFAIRMANLNTLIATMQDQLGMSTQGSPRIVTIVQETTRSKLDAKLNELLEFLSPDELVHLSVTPTTPGKYLIILAHHDYSL